MAHALAALLVVLQIAHDAGEGEVQNEVEESGEAEQQAHLAKRDGVAGVGVELGHQVFGVKEQLAHGHLRAERGILDNGVDLAHHRGDNAAEALRYHDIPERADKREALAGGRLKLAFRYRVQAAAHDLSHHGRGEQHVSAADALKDRIERRRDVADEHPQQVRRVAENFDIKAGDIFQDKFVVVADKPQHRADDDRKQDTDGRDLDRHAEADHNIPQIGGGEDRSKCCHTNSSSIFSISRLVCTSRCFRRSS